MRILIGLVFIVGLVQCSKQQNHLPEVHPVNVGADVNEAAAIGEVLFFSPILSLDSTISCSSCHIPQFAFADTARVSAGVHSRAGFRNSPSIFNVAYKKKFFAEGGVKGLERATLAPMLTNFEMGVQAPELMSRIKSDRSLHSNFVEVFGENYDYAHVVRALVAYQFNLRSVDSKYDRILAQNQEADSLWLKGKRLFESNRLDCSRCHAGVLQRDTLFHDLGLPTDTVVEGGPDYGRGRLTHDRKDFFHFPTPSLRNVELTAPYMHDGSIPTLDSVVRFYEAGGGPRKSNSLRVTFELNDDEREALMTFLLSLTGEEASRLNSSIN
ncbi:MAG: hypothetical protein HWE14_02520 [Flavobacteriia bacterium]|nr:hypothetical protein [Flavobacteriia bacterium]